MKKKSLDEYLMFLRYGITMNFDFKNNINNTFGSLRNYIKKFDEKIHF